MKAEIGLTPYFEPEKTVRYAICMTTIPADRLFALNAFPGMTIAAMILVNTPGS